MKNKPTRNELDKIMSDTSEHDWIKLPSINHTEVFERHPEIDRLPFVQTFDGIEHAMESYFTQLEEKGLSVDEIKDLIQERVKSIDLDCINLPMIKKHPEGIMTKGMIPLVTGLMCNEIDIVAMSKILKLREASV